MRIGGVANCCVVSSLISYFLNSWILFLKGLTDSVVGFCQSVEKLFTYEGDVCVSGTTTLRCTCLRLIALNCLLFIPIMFVVHTIIEFTVRSVISLLLQYWLFMVDPRDIPIYQSLMEGIVLFIFEGIAFSVLYVVTTIITCHWINKVNLVSQSPTTRCLPSTSVMITVSDNIVCFLGQTVFIIQIQILALLPHFVFHLISLLKLSILYSFYAFDYRWADIGLAMNRRVFILETQWQYFAGFGLPLAFTQYLHTYFLRLGLFYSLFHFFVMSANLSQFIPNLNSENSKVRLPIMWPAFKISNYIVQVLVSTCNRRLGRK